ncbi:MAG: PAS domain S-box protein [Spirochaetota bacterium]|nr:PAS domain S-box protein [Spirochaetota bacterium]
MQRKILLVEDEAIIALNFSQMIEKHGFSIVTAGNGVHAVEMFGSDKDISLVLMDINLGRGMDGTETARSILSIREVPIVFLTSYTDSTTVQKVKNITRYGYVPKNLGEFVLIEAVSMAYELFEAHQKIKKENEERKKTAEELKESEEKYRSLYCNAPLPYQSLDEEGRILEVNPAWLDTLGGYTQAEVTGKPFTDFLHPEFQDLFRKNFPEFKRKGTIKGIEFRLLKKDGRYIETCFQGSIGHTKDGKMKQTHCIFQDTTGRKSIEERLEGTMMAGNIAWWEMTLPSGEVDFNEQKTRILGYEKKDFTTYHDFTELIHPDDFEQTMQAMRHCLGGEEPRYIADYRIRTSSGAYRWFHDVGAVTSRGQDGPPMRITGVVVDVTDLKEYELKLKQKNRELNTLLEEKSFPMREIFHRVKNNLAMVYSLVALKEINSGYDLTDVKSQISVIRIIYEKLHRQEATSNIEFSQYIVELLESIFSFHEQPVEISRKLPKVIMHTREAVSLGLIVNEIATNAIKYGFILGEPARFFIQIREDAVNNVYTLTLSNSGRPFPEEVDFPNKDTMGLRLVSELVRQINGTIELQREPQTTFIIQFPPSDETGVE